MQRLLTIAWLTWKAAFRFRLFLVITVLLLLSVVGLPLILQDDGTARGFTQILITYTLSTITGLLGLSTLWLSCGTLARDIEECQIQVVAVKPIARWQIWLGKWLGLVSLDAALLAISGACVYGLLQWRAGHLPAAEQQVLRNEVLVARGSVRLPSFDKDIDAETDQLLRERLEKNVGEGVNLKEVRTQIREQVKSQYQIVPSGYSRPWQLDLGSARSSLAGKQLHLRIKFNTADHTTSGTYAGFWRIGVPNKTRLYQSEMQSLAPDTFHEIPIPPDLFDDTGVLTVTFVNMSPTTLLFPLEDGIEVLYPEAGFTVNFVRGLGVIFCWMALFAALGLTAASFLSFPVAAFLALGVLTMVFASGTMANAVEEGTIANYNAEKGTKGWSPADVVVIPTFKATLWVIGLAKNFSPIDSLSTGGSVSWEELGKAFAQIIGILSGLLALIGMVIFTRRELATAQGTQ